MRFSLGQEVAIALGVASPAKSQERKTVQRVLFVAAGPVSRILSAALLPRSSRRARDGTKPKSGRTVIPLGRALLRGSSDLPGSSDVPSRHVRPPKPTLLPYLVLLRVWFSLPPSLLTARCALTAPFHPYLARPNGQTRRYIFCGTFRRLGLNPASRTLSGTPLCGVRTFLSPFARPGLTAEAGPLARNGQCSQTGSDHPAQQLTA